MSSIMNPKHEIKLSKTPQLSPELQSMVDEFKNIFIRTQEHLKKIEESGRLVEKSIEMSIEARKAGNDLYIKKGHNSEVHNEIFRWYSRSIMLAPMGTEELALGFGNRSALLMHLHLYEEALVDTDRALQLSKSDDYKKKLEARKKKCLELINEQTLKAAENSSQNDSEDLENLAAKLKNFNPSVTIPCAADCVGLAYNNTFGRHLVATRDIEPGEILIVEKGSACCPLLNEINIVCSHCLQYAWNGIPCDECVYVIYCSEACKNEAYNEYHDIECPMFKYMDFTVFNNEVNGPDRIVTIRLLIKAVRKEGYQNVISEIGKIESKDNLDVLLTDGILESEKLKSCYNLLSHVKQLESNQQLEFHSVQILYLLLEHTDFLVTFKGENHQKSVAEFQRTINPNATFMIDYTFTLCPSILLALQQALTKLKRVTVTNQYLFEYRPWQCGCNKNFLECDNECNLVRGIVIAPCCTLLNHSCTPNVSHLCAPKREVIVFSTCPIKKGEMLCDSYKGISIVNNDLKSRQNKIRYFSCKCRACIDKIDMFVASDDSEKDMDEIRVELAENFPKSRIDLFLKGSVEDFETSDEFFQDMIQVSQLIYKHFNYYKAYVHSYKCKAFFEKIMSKLYKEKNVMPDSC